MGHFGHGWVSVDGVGDVFENGPHLKRKGPLADQFTDVGADALDAEDTVVVFSGNHTNEAPGFLCFLGERTAVRSERELPCNDRMARFLGLVG